MATAQLEDLSGSDLLDEVERLHATQHRAEVRILKAAVQLAVIHDAATVDPEQALLPGRERAVRLGGEGTPKVAEFAGATLGARLQLSPYAAGRLIADALDLKHRLPRLWARLERLEVRVGHARYVARRTRDLTLAEAQLVDERVAESADGRLSWTRFTDLVEAAIIEADPETARAAEEAAARQVFAKATRSTEHGMRGFYVRAPFAVIARLDATVAYVAEALQALGDTSCLDQRRVKAMLVLANPIQAVELLKAYAAWRAHALGEPIPGITDPRRFDPDETSFNDAEPGRGTDFEIDESKLLPTIWLFVHLAGWADKLGDVARVEGMGPITADWVKDHLSGQCRFKITPVLDLAGQTPVDAYEIPDRHRQAVHLMTPADIFPYSANTTRDQQIDHTEPYRPGHSGQSRVGNYGPMTGFHHRIKTHGGWQVRQPFPGIYVWRDPHGALFLVDHTGTRRIKQIGDVALAA